MRGKHFCNTRYEQNNKTFVFEEEYWFRCKKAIEYYEQALKIAKEIGDRRGEGNRLGNLGIAYKNLGDAKKAIEFLKESLTIGKLIKDPRIISFCEQRLKELEEFNK